MERFFAVSLSEPLGGGGSTPLDRCWPPLGHTWSDWVNPPTHQDERVEPLSYLPTDLLAYLPTYLLPTYLPTYVPVLKAQKPCSRVGAVYIDINQC